MEAHSNFRHSEFEQHVRLATARSLDGRGNHLHFFKGRVLSADLAKRGRSSPDKPAKAAQRLARAASDAGGLIFGPLPRTGINRDNRREHCRIGDIPARIGCGAAAVEDE